MAAYISVPRDLTKVKSKVAFNLTKRQLVCFGTAALIGVPLFFVLRDSGGNTAATLGMMAVMLPAFFLGMYEKNGQPMEKLLSYYVQSRFLRPKIRPYKTNNLTLVDDYHTDYSDGSGQQFITLVSESGNTFYLVIDRNAKGQQTVHFMNLVDEADLLALMEEDAADAYTAEKEAAAQAEQDRLKSEEEAKKAAEEAAASGTEQPKENKVTKIASGFLGVVVLIALAAGGIFYAFAKQKQKKQAEKEALDPDANYTEDKGDFEIPTDVPDEQDTEPI